MRTKNEALLKSITTQNNREKLEKYTENISIIQRLKNDIEYLDGLSQRVAQTQEMLNLEIGEMNIRLPVQRGYKELKFLDFTSLVYGIFENRKLAETEKNVKEDENEGIKKDFQQDGFTGDLSSLLQNAGTYQSWVNWADEQLKVITKKEGELYRILERRSGLSTDLKNEYENQKKKIDKAWLNILDKHQGEQQGLIERILLKDNKISVMGEVVFDQDTFYRELLKIVDKRSYKNINALKDRLQIFNFDDWIKFIRNDLSDFLDNGVEAEKFHGIKELLFDRKARGTYLNTLPKITYGGKRLKRLSVGQRGTVYLCLKLATDAFSKPIIFDQPEDDLDNKFIVEELIDIFRELKKYRQIVIVTHNANLVVNADAEQVIIASNDNETLTYKSGSLENESIIDGVCEILEGGEEAFEKRKHKYRFN